MFEEVWYAYTRGGQLKTRVTRYPTSPPAGKNSGTYYIVGAQYNINQQLWLLRLAEQDVETGAVTRTLAREYRYDGDGRVRYYERDRDPEDLAPIGPTAEKWREFLGSSVYADLDVVDAPPDLQASASRRYVHASDGRLVAWFDVPDSEHPAGQWHYVHADMLGTTRLVTDGAGNVGSGLAWTAFGELAGAAFPGGPAAASRYGYCGGWGYEDDTLPVLAGGSADPAAGLGLLHVGARWYAPGLGRFVQRDPTGFVGGINPYVSFWNNPTVFVDPRGEDPLVGVAVGAAIGATLGALTTGTIEGAGLGLVAGAGGGLASAAAYAIAGSYFGASVAGGAASGALSGFFSAQADGLDGGQSVAAGIFGGVLGAGMGAIGGHLATQQDMLWIIDAMGGLGTFIGGATEKTVGVVCNLLNKANRTPKRTY